MTLGYDKPLYLLAFDHRGSFEQDLFGVVRAGAGRGARRHHQRSRRSFSTRTSRRLRRGAPADACGGPGGRGVRHRASRGGRRQQAYRWPCRSRSLARRSSSSSTATTSAAHIEAFDPDVRQGAGALQPGRRRGPEPAADRAAGHGSATGCATMTASSCSSCWCRRRRPSSTGSAATSASTTASCGPSLVVATIAALQAGGVEPDIWKIEGLDRPRTRARRWSRRRGPSGRDGVTCIVLGRGADEPQVIEWVKIGASVDGFDGFAVGRTLWEQALQGLPGAARPRGRRQ